jgi:amidase
MPESARPGRSVPRRRAQAAATLAVSAIAALAATSPASAVNTVSTANGAAWQIHDAASPALDTGSVRAITDNAFYGFGGIKVRVGSVPASDPTAKFNGETIRGFGLEFDGVDSFATTHAVRLGGVQISRAVKVGTAGNWTRWVDSFRNTTDQDIAVEVSFGGTAGLNTTGQQSQVVASSSGDTTIAANDSWVEVANSGAAGPATRGPHAVVLGTASFSGTTFGTGNQQRNPFSTALPTTGLDANFYGYENTITVPAGRTVSLLHFVVAGRGETAGTAGSQITAVRNAATSLAASPNLDDLSVGVRCSIANFNVATTPGFDPAACATAKAPEIHPPVGPERHVTTSKYDVVDKSITELLADMASGATTSQEITRAYLDRIAAYDTGAFGFHAYIHVADDAMAQAKAADEARAKGSKLPLLGVPVSLKDLYDTKDMPTTDGTLALKDWQPKKDAFQVARIRAAGAVILGKSNLSEFANSGSYSESGFGMTANAFGPSKSSLGSSGGPAVSTALSMAGFAMGTQTGVSLYAPSTGASLVSLRGTDGISSGSGVMPLTYLQDFEGPIARTTSDIARVLNVTTGTDPDDPATVHADADAKRPADWTTSLDPGALRGKRIGYIPNAFDGDPTTYTYGQDDGTAAAVRARFADLEAAGATMVPITAPAPSQSTTVPGGTGNRSRTEEGWQSYWEDQENPPFTTASGILSSPKNLPYNRRTLAPAPRLTTDDVDRIIAARDAAKALWKTYMDDAGVDAIVYPGFRSDVYENDGAQTLSSDRGTNVPTSNVGLPTLILPVGANPHGDPISLQIVGRAFDDAKVLGYGYALEQQLGGKGHLLSSYAPRLAYDATATPTTPVIATPPAPVTTAPAEKPTETSPAASAPASGTAAPAATTPAAPARTVRVSTRGVRLDRQGRFAITVSCAKGRTSCRVRVVVKRGSSPVATRTVTVRAGRSVRLLARPNAAMRRSLLRGRTVSVRVALSGTGIKATSGTLRVAPRR